jgi:cell wall-associated NlpC family hydrolase
MAKIDRLKIIRVAMERIHREYLFGAKWPLNNMNPQGAIDCSGFTRWCYWRGGYTIPEGSQEQFDETIPIEHPLSGDLGFFAHVGEDGKPDLKKIHHVGIFNSSDVIEARGEPYNQVILRPSAKWEAWKEFTGWRRFREVEN